MSLRDARGRSCGGQVRPGGAENDEIKGEPWAESRIETGKSVPDPVNPRIRVLPPALVAHRHRWFDCHHLKSAHGQRRREWRLWRYSMRSNSGRRSLVAAPVMRSMTLVLNVSRTIFRVRGLGSLARVGGALSPLGGSTAPVCNRGRSGPPAGGGIYPVCQTQTARLENQGRRFNRLAGPWVPLSHPPGRRDFLTGLRAV